MLWPPPKFVDKIGIFMFTNQLSNTHSVSFKGMINLLELLVTKVKNVYPCTPQFYYIKVKCKGV